MAKKTWKLGEWCKGGIITSEVKGDKIIIIGKEWDRSQGDKRGSSQANAKEFTRLTFTVDNYDDGGAMSIYLNNLTSYGYAEQIIDWVKSKI